MAIKNKYKLDDWNEYYKREKKIHLKHKTGFFSSYDIYLCESILKKFLPKENLKLSSRLKICEIGSGDGKLLSRLSLMFGYNPYGIEYSSVASKNYENLGITPIICDIFDEKILSKYANYFDIVYSYGFIEHIYPPEKAVSVHLKILKPGGLFFIQIPRLKGFNYWKTRFFRPELLPLHNLDIMEEDELRKLCRRPDVEELFCRNYGTLKLRLPLDKKNFRYYLMKFILLSDYLLNPFLRILFKDRGFETRFFSSAVIFIGRKNAK
ncbi:methyltransferase domain-containing protein [Candidatus Wolfebacteria bacterium]|nr:methyltransferase domain-containing protein [Candidatus Wolfebacteria bacterium]